MGEKKRANKFEEILKMKKLIIISIILFVIGLFPMFGWLINYDLIKPSTIINPIINTIMKPEYFGAFFTLLGAIVGGTFTLLGSVLVNNRNTKMQIQIKRRNEIYKSLYDELRKTQNMNILKPYPFIIHLDEKDVLDEEYPKYVEWWKLKSDSRSFEVPWYVDTAYCDLNKKIIEYKEKLILAQRSIYDKVSVLVGIDEKEIINKSDVDPTKTLLLRYILLEDKSHFQDGIFCIYGREKFRIYIADKEKMELAFKAYEACLELPEVIEIRGIYKEWLDKEKETIELLKSLIVHINKKYEKNAGGLFYV